MAHMWWIRIWMVANEAGVRTRGETMSDDDRGPAKSGYGPMLVVLVIMSMIVVGWWWFTQVFVERSRKPAPATSTEAPSQK